MAALGFYGAMGVAALAWSEARGGPPVFALGTPDPVTQVLYGVALGAPVVGLSRWVSTRLAWARLLNEEFRAMLGRLSTADIAVLAGGSAVGEEMLFRGAMQPALGLGLTTLIFGVAHLPPKRSLWPWTATAAVVGLGLGGLYELTHSILAPVVAHFTVNWFNLHALVDAPEDGEVGP